jgi:hypothetical protein
MRSDPHKGDPNQKKTTVCVSLGDDAGRRIGDIDYYSNAVSSVAPIVANTPMVSPNLDFLQGRWASLSYSSDQLPLNGILAGPLAGRGLVSGSVGLVDVGNLGHQRVVGVGVRQHGADGQQN